MKKQLIAFLCSGILLLIIHNAHAQELRFGAKGGLSWYSLKIEIENVSMKQNSKAGFALGAFALYSINDILSIQPEILVMKKNGEDYWGESLSLSYIELPILAHVNLPIESSFTSHLLAGPSVGFLTSATIGDYGVNDWFKSTNFGFSFGVGAGYNKLNFDLRYDFGLTNIDDYYLNTGNYRYNTSGLLLTVGYLLN